MKLIGCLKWVRVKRGNGKRETEKRVKGGKAEKRVKGGKAEKRVKGGKAENRVKGGKAEKRVKGGKKSKRRKTTLFKLYDQHNYNSAF